jgi:glycosyltransferase involved in cell wall biosynthesis
VKAAPIPVAVVVMTRNEAGQVVACLASLQRCFAQVFVVDSASTDGTPELAAAFDVAVVPFRWNGRYPKKKQWCLENLAFAVDWVLFVDADERATPAFLEDLARTLAEDEGMSAYWISARPTILGRTLRFGRRHRKIALVDRRRCRYLALNDLDIPTMWEVEGHYQPAVEGPVGRIRSPIIHRDAERIGHWVARHDRYSDWAARLEADGRIAEARTTEPRYRRLLKRLVTNAPFRPFLAFIDSFIVRLGFLDGAAGFHYAMSRAFYYWLIDVKRTADSAVRRR